ncbi:MAG: hypothetical protein QOH19_745, partial [Actinomycetota bacterium]|nr:hypothetical protein [Actinomycetota bacterium]
MKPAMGLLGIISFLGLWELVPWAGIVDRRFLPPASEVVAALVGDLGLGRFWVAVGQTMQAWAIGLAV